MNYTTKEGQEVKAGPHVVGERNLFRTKKGDLTRYALACGYVQRRSNEFGGNDEDHKSVQLYMDGSVIHVRVYRREDNRREVFSTNNLTEARRVFRQKCKEFGL